MSPPAVTGVGAPVPYTEVARTNEQLGKAVAALRLFQGGRLYGLLERLLPDGVEPSLWLTRRLTEGSSRDEADNAALAVLRLEQYIAHWRLVDRAVAMVGDEEAIALLTEERIAVRAKFAHIPRQRKPPGAHTGLCQRISSSSRWPRIFNTLLALQQMAPFSRT